MDLEAIRNHCLIKPAVTESLPFDEDSPVYKVKNKIFLIMSLTEPFSINVKCDPELAVELREKYSFIIPGYHMNKTHWNTVLLEHNVTDKLIKEMIDNSYDLIVAGLPKKIQKELEESE
jgi:predicted DNA-binding protein (MmcQ/YjbR family)